MFHVKPWADTITFAAVSDTLSSPRVVGSPMSGARFHVKHSREPRTLEPSRLPDRQRQRWGRDTQCLGPTVNRRIRAGYSSSRDVPGASASTRRARSSSPANSMVMRPFFAPRVTFTRVSKASDSRVESAGRGVLRARKTLG